LVNNILRNRTDGSLNLANQQLLQNFTDLIATDLQRATYWRLGLFADAMRECGGYSSIV
jgi:hypothetical protein